MINIDWSFKVLYVKSNSVIAESCNRPRNNYDDQVQPVFILLQHSHEWFTFNNTDFWVLLDYWFKTKNLKY